MRTSAKPNKLYIIRKVLMRAIQKKRAELWTSVKSEREKFPDKVMETVAKEYGHEILRLPSYHCELNPIKLAWAAEKNYVAGENKDMSLDSVEKLFRKKREELPEDFYGKLLSQ